MGYAREVVELKDSGGDYQSRVGRGVGKVRMDAMRARFDDFVETEERLRDERSQGTRRAARLAVGTGGAAALLLGVILAFSVGRQLVSVSSAYGGALDSEQEQRRRLGTTLQSIGDAVIVTDAGGRVTLMNPVAESVTGWKTGDARGRPLPEVFRIVNEETRAEVENPVKEVLRADAVVGLANHTLLIAKGGAESEGRGRGATFSVRLPVLAPEGNAGAAAARGPGGDAPSIERTPKLDGVRVLLVDDDRDTLEMLDAVLLRCEAEVVTAASAAEALSEIERRRPDVLVSDIGMPEADGYELIKSVRASEAERGGAAIPALALTAYAKAEDRVRALAAGYQAHLAKPVEPAEFALVVASLAGRGQK
jgi:PAS domain S-box-containing protein